MYMVQCNRCNLQYIGETKQRLKDRFYEHRRAVDKINIKSREKMYSLPDSVRKARESHLIDRVWFRGKCLKQGIKKSEFCLKQGRKISDFCLKQGEGMRGRAAPPHPRMYRVSPPRLGRLIQV